MLASNLARTGSQQLERQENTLLFVLTIDSGWESIYKN